MVNSVTHHDRYAEAWNDQDVEAVSLLCEFY
jgi:hypothetical protein